ncbi:MAG: DNA mismatch repair protein MutS [Cyclobacteriaceae bacterium]
MKEINEEEIQRLKGQWNSFDGGEMWADSRHDYCNDLDILGQNSLFQLINRASTKIGKEILAKWLLAPASKSEIGDRQEAVQEITGKIEWRQEFQAAHASNVDEESKLTALLEWLKKIITKPNNVSQFFYLTMTVLMVSSIVAWAIDITTYHPMLIIWLINTGFLYKLQAEIRDLDSVYSKLSPLMKSYEKMMSMVENETFSARLLASIHAIFRSENTIASEKLADLKSKLQYLDARSNMFYWVFNSFFLLDFWIVRGLNHWTIEHGKSLGKWTTAIGEMEALSSIAAYSFAHSHFVYPEIVEDPYTYEAQEIVHPLILKGAVGNDFSLIKQGSIGIVTGSNMAGKSTFLRTLGINAVLAFAGAPVSAKKLKLSYFQVFTCMRTRDDLAENISSFYAELLRLKQLLTELESGKTVFFLLDEILKGTNSADRHKGAEALIKKLSKMSGFGLVSTHDLELGKMEDVLPNVKNLSFNARFDGDDLHFDYKLREGLCNSFNAAGLMRIMGIMD